MIEIPKHVAESIDPVIRRYRPPKMAACLMTRLSASSLLNQSQQWLQRRIDASQQRGQSSRLPFF